MNRDFVSAEDKPVLGVLFARKPAKKMLKKNNNQRKTPFTAEELVNEYGEPYFFQKSSPYHGQPAVLVLGAGRYWRTIADGIDVYGEALDPTDKDELLEAIDSRREGEIWGRWYSTYCPDGEFGYMHVSRCVEINVDEFDDFRLKF